MRTALQCRPKIDELPGPSPCIFSTMYRSDDETGCCILVPIPHAVQACTYDCNTGKGSDDDAGYRPAAEPAITAAGGRGRNIDS
jgi:hypothetical protein